MSLRWIIHKNLEKYFNKSSRYKEGGGGFLEIQVIPNYEIFKIHAVVLSIVCVDMQVKI